VPKTAHQFIVNYAFRVFFIRVFSRTKKAAAENFGGSIELFIFSHFFEA